jgi:hypothetical protein
MKGLAMLAVATAAMFAGALPAVADPPPSTTFTESFVDINPCSGLLHTVTITVTVYFPVPEHTAHAKHLITTSSGFIGRGVEVGQFDDAHFIINDMLVNPQTGERIRAQFHVTGAPSDPRITRNEVECVGGGSS